MGLHLEEVVTLRLCGIIPPLSRSLRMNDQMSFSCRDPRDVETFDREVLFRIGLNGTNTDVLVGFEVSDIEGSECAETEMKADASYSGRELTRPGDCYGEN